MTPDGADNNDHVPLKIMEDAMRKDLVLVPTYHRVHANHFYHHNLQSPTLSSSSSSLFIGDYVLGWRWDGSGGNQVNSKRQTDSSFGSHNLTLFISQ